MNAVAVQEKLSSQGSSSFQARSSFGDSNKLFKVLILLGFAWIAFRTVQIQHDSTPRHAESIEVKVVRVIDGDTLLIQGDDRVRLLGVDTPEMKHPRLPPQPFGAEATQFTTQLVEGKTVRLVFDKERYDDYRRILAFVYLEDGTFLNEELVLAGLATAEAQYPFRSDIKKQLSAAQEHAESLNLGIWSKPNDQKKLLEK